MLGLRKVAEKSRSGNAQMGIEYEFEENIGSYIVIPSEVAVSSPLGRISVGYDDTKRMFMKRVLVYFI